MDRATATQQYVSALSTLAAHLKLIDGLLELVLARPKCMLTTGEMRKYRCEVDELIAPLRNEIDEYLDSLKRELADNRWLMEETNKQLEAIGKLLRNQADGRQDLAGDDT